MRNWIVGVLLASLLAGCGRSAPAARQPEATTGSATIATAQVMLTAVANGTAQVGPAGGQNNGMDAGVASIPVAGDVLPTNIGAAEQTIRDYFGAFGERRAADAWALLAPAMRSGMTPEMLESTTLAVQSLSFSRIDSVRAIDQRLIYGVTINVVPTPELPTIWHNGANKVYVSLVRTAEGWRIAAISSEAPSS